MISNKTFAEQAIEVAPRVWWVGHVLKEDSFQCHTYLIEQGDQSVLIDPGSLLTFTDTLRKIEQILPFDQIRYFVCQHQDPDITASLPLINERVTRDDCAIICHGRAAALIKHYKLDIPFLLVDEDLNWSLPLPERTLKFIFTPYAHFPAAICSFDDATGSLFSSDLFGGFTDDFALYAESEDYFEAMRPFHEHYMPSNAILQHALESLKDLPIQQIMPQHGSIIPQHLVEPMFSRLMVLECGLFLQEETMSEAIRLSEINKTLLDINKVMLLSKDFREIAAGLLDITQRFLPVTSLEFYSKFNKNQFLHLTAKNHFRGTIATPPPHLQKMLAMNMEEWNNKLLMGYDSIFEENGHSPSLILSLSSDEVYVSGIAIIQLSETFLPDAAMDRIITRIRSPLQVAVERETIYQTMEKERQQIYDRASRDPLTKLFTRFYMQDTVQRILDLQKRDENTSINLALLDIDHFKEINDNHGHSAGDMALQKVAAVVLQEVRSSDLPVRLGGDEFAIFLVGTSGKKAMRFSERLREKVKELQFPEPLEKETITVSIGVTEGKAGETLENFIERADKALYLAKGQGRNQVQHIDI